MGLERPIGWVAGRVAKQPFNAIGGVAGTAMIVPEAIKAPPSPRRLKRKQEMQKVLGQIALAKSASIEDWYDVLVKVSARVPIRNMKPKWVANVIKPRGRGGKVRLQNIREAYQGAAPKRRGPYHSGGRSGRAHADNPIYDQVEDATERAFKQRDDKIDMLTRQVEDLRAAETARMNAPPRSRIREMEGRVAAPGKGLLPPLPRNWQEAQPWLLTAAGLGAASVLYGATQEGVGSALAEGSERYRRMGANRRFQAAVRVAPELDTPLNRRLFTSINEASPYVAPRPASTSST
jgi:hypothetical protein